ncbi:hypothetical protein VH570_06555 [Sphingobium sp. HT1-2]|uniref:hypothetical protein n=1 Tax=Sphingobium sp. HT1-2 TaxID=3111640 RepID=UPI0012F8C2C9
MARKPRKPRIPPAQPAPEVTLLPEPDITIIRTAMHIHDVFMDMLKYENEIGEPYRMDELVPEAVGIKLEPSLLAATDGSFAVLKIQDGGYEITGAEAYMKWCGRFFPGLTWDTLHWGNHLDDDGNLIDNALPTANPDTSDNVGKSNKRAYQPRLTYDFVLVMGALLKKADWITASALRKSTGAARSSVNNAITGAMKAGLIDRSVLEPYAYRMTGHPGAEQNKMIERIKAAINEMNETS